MKPEIDYISINKNSWNKKTPHHLVSDFYDVPAFVEGKNSLKDIELTLLGDIKGKSILHLQCHFGQDSISLSRLGAHVTGVDLSDESIKAAKELAKNCNASCEFICCNIYELEQYIDKKFDIVFTSYGTIGWLPDLQKWANIIANCLQPNGQFIFVEFHPVVWMFDEQFEKISYPYLNSGPIAETYTGTYADKSADLTQEYVMWNHGIGEVLSSLINANLKITSFEEFDYSPYNCFNKTNEFEKGKYRISTLENRIPMVYALSASKNK